MTPEEKPNITIGVTHGGVFQADEVFATALLKILYPSIKIMRVSEVPESLKSNPSVIVYDIGGGKYDHHQQPLETRSNGVAYSSFGLVWRDFGHYILPNEQSFKFVDKMLVEYIDKHDNGQETNLLSVAFRWINMSWQDEDRSNMDQFNKAVEAAKYILEGLIHRKKSEEEADRLVDIALDRNPGHILILDRYVPLSPDIREDVYYYIYPNERNGYNVSIINDKNKMARRYLPGEWYRERPEGMKFIHRSGKFANFDSMEHAIDATNKALHKDIYIKETPITLLNKNGFKITTNDDHEVELDSIVVMENSHACILEYTDNDVTAINLNPMVINKEEPDTIRINTSVSYGMLYKHNWGNDPTKAGLICDIENYNKNAKNKIVYILYKGGNKILI